MMQADIGCCDSLAYLVYWLADKQDGILDKRPGTKLWATGCSKHSRVGFSYSSKHHWSLPGTGQVLIHELHPKHTGH